MVTNLVNRPLGLGNGDGLCGVLVDYIPQKKLWLGAALGAVAGVASSLIGGSQASKAAKEAERRQRERENEEKAWYSRRYNEDYIDTAAGQNLVRRAKEFAKEQWKKAAGAQAVAGGTDAATQMAKDAGTKMMGDTIADIAAADQSRKDSVDNMHQKSLDKFAQMDMDRAMQRAQNITNATQGASNALISAGAAIDQAGLGKTDLNGGSNGSSPYVKVEEGVYAGNGVPTVDLRGVNGDIKKASSSMFGR